MAQAPITSTGIAQQQQPHQLFPGPQSYYSGDGPPAGMPAMAVPPVSGPGVGMPGGVNMGTPGTLLPDGRFVPSGTVAAAVPAPVHSTGPTVFPPGLAGVQSGDGVVVPNGPNPAAPVVDTQEEPPQYVGVPPGMTRESMQPGYDPRLKEQRWTFNPEWSFKDSFGNSRGKRCCTIS